jgi:hypothetical protein
MTLHVDLTALSDAELEAAYRAELAALGVDEADAQAELEERPARALEWWDELRREYPLADAVLWERDDAPWDQRRLVACLVDALTLAVGGNRSGKTYAIIQACLAFALGADHPAVEAWLVDNELPAGLVPDGPGEVFMVARTHESSILYHRLTLDKLLPATGCTWRGKHANAPASLEIAVPGYDQPARIWFKAIDQGHGAFKGSEVRFVAISEEPEGLEGRRVLEECLRGCSSVGGRVVLEMTPQLGFTWVYEDLYEARHYDCRVVELDSEHNMMVPDHASLMRWLESLPPEQRAMRQKGKFTNLEGLVYVGWTRGTGERFGPGHLCEPFDIPADWPRFRGGDFGLSDATSIPWIARGDDDTLYVYRYLHEPSPTFEEHAKWVASLEALLGDTIEGAWGDPSSPGESAIETFSTAGVGFGVANKEVLGGISKVAERLRLRPDGRPRIKLFTGLQPKDAALIPPEYVISGCRVGMPGILKRKPGNVAVSELEAYRWDPKVKVPQPIKKDDHFLDALRYVVVGIDEWGSLSVW